MFSTSGPFGGMNYPGNFPFGENHSAFNNNFGNHRGRGGPAFGRGRGGRGGAAFPFGGHGWGFPFNEGSPFGFPFEFDPREGFRGDPRAAFFDPREGFEFVDRDHDEDDEGPQIEEVAELGAENLESETERGDDQGVGEAEGREGLNASGGRRGGGGRGRGGFGGRGRGGPGGRGGGGRGGFGRGGGFGGRGRHGHGHGHGFGGRGGRGGHGFNGPDGPHGAFNFFGGFGAPWDQGEHAPNWQSGPQAYWHGFDGFGRNDGQVRPRVDVTEIGGQYIVEVELPGVRKDEVVALIGEGGRSVEIEGTAGNANVVEGQGEVIMSERALVHGAKFARTIQLPGRVQPEGVTAELKDGVLTIKVQKLEAQNVHVEIA